MFITLYIASNLLQTKKRDLVSAFTAAFVYTLSNIIIGLALPPGQPYAIILFFALLALFYVVIKLVYDESPGKTLLLLLLAWVLTTVGVMVLGIVLWQAGVYSMV